VCAGGGCVVGLVADGCAARRPLSRPCVRAPSSKGHACGGGERGVTCARCPLHSFPFPRLGPRLPAAAQRKQERRKWGARVSVAWCKIPPRPRLLQMKRNAAHTRTLARAKPDGVLSGAGDGKCGQRVERRALLRSPPSSSSHCLRLSSLCLSPSLSAVPLS